MANSNPKRENLRQESPKWQNLPTVAVRIPEKFKDQLLAIARSLDEGQPAGLDMPLNLETVNQWLKSLDADLLLDLKAKVEIALVEAKERKCDRRLEQAITYLASRCDGAFSQDGQGFNGADTAFGHWLAELIEQQEPILKNHAQSALKMLRKYIKQLEGGGLGLPNWETIEHQYPDKIKLTTLMMLEGKEKRIIPEKRIQVIGDMIAVYAPYDSSGRFQRKAKNIEGYKFNGEDKSWRWSINKIAEVTAAFSQDDEYHYDPNIEGAIALVEIQKSEELAQLKAEALEKSDNIIKLVSVADLDAPLSNGWYLRDYQKRGVEWLLAHCRGGIYTGGVLADHMGLGKTLTTLAAAKVMQRTHHCPIFVIAPVSLLENWRREAELAQVRIECFSWSKIPKALESQKYALIADEAHYAQNERSQRTQKLLALAHSENCIATWMLTGTPIKNGRPINLYPLLLAANHPLAENRLEYQKRYCNAHHKSFGKKTVWDVTGTAHLDELAKKTEDVILRRTKAECLPELPAKTRLFKQAELEADKSKEYEAEIKRLVEDYRDRAKAGLVDADSEALVTLNYLRKVGSQFKVDAAIALAEELLEQGQQVVMFTEFLESANALYAALGGELLTGESKSEDRQAMIDRFQAGDSKVFIGTIKAGGVGITLTAASHVVLVDRAWTPGDCEQAEDRCHRLGQSNAVFATWIQLGQIDFAIDNLLQAKQERIELVLKGKRKTLRKLDSPKELAKELLEIL
ncbi:DEAD/DEAH box helicase [Microcoleus sp. OTE_8_concoct_300]|uniref:DEAD/DEAH box helicase n=1 Tax=Microcoleus sp. OTE_8_concoct_300 TaxID=2964710 RepID=UPI00403FC07B